MLPTFTIIISDDTFSKEACLAIVKASEGKEILGQLVDADSNHLGINDPEKVSHIVKNIRFNFLTQKLIADIGCLPTTYGLHLATAFKQSLDNLIIKPIFYGEKLITVNIGIRKNNEEI